MIFSNEQACGAVDLFYLIRYCDEIHLKLGSWGYGVEAALLLSGN